jgi:hypothetical protein
VADKQKVLRVKESGFIVRGSYPVVNLFVILKNELLAWIYQRELCSPIIGFKNIFGRQDGNKYIIIDDRTCLPLSPYLDILLPGDQLANIKDTNRLAELSAEYTERNQEKESQKRRFVDFLGYAMIFLIFGVLVFAFMVFKKGGLK